MNVCKDCGQFFNSIEPKDICRMCIHVVDSEAERYEKLKDKASKDPARYLSA